MRALHNVTDKYTELLREKGYRITPIRKALLNILKEGQLPLSVSDIAQALKNKKVSAHKTTVYRELSCLEREGLVMPVRIGRALQYQLPSEDHRHHLVCTECHLVEDVVLPDDLKEQEKTIEKSKRFRITRHALEFFGVCRECDRAER